MVCVPPSADRGPPATSLSVSQRCASGVRAEGPTSTGDAAPMKRRQLRGRDGRGGVWACNCLPFERHDSQRHGTVAQYVTGGGAAAQFGERPTLVSAHNHKSWM